MKPEYYQINYLSQVYLENAIFLSEKCKEIEELQLGNLGHSAYFYGSFFNCISCLEANINENYVRITGKFLHPKFKNIPASAREFGCLCTRAACSGAKQEEIL